MRKLSSLWASQAGVAAVEMALIAPVIAGVAVVSYTLWETASRREDMRAALKAGAAYYMSGGRDDGAARSLLMSAWPQPPADAAGTVSRACACGAAAGACNTLCADGSPPAIYLTLSATATAANGIGETPLAEQKVVRVR